MPRPPTPHVTNLLQESERGKSSYQMRFPAQVPEFFKAVRQAANSFNKMLWTTVLEFNRDPATESHVQSQFWSSGQKATSANFMFAE